MEKECNSVCADAFPKGSPGGGGLTCPHVLGECQARPDLNAKIICVVKIQQGKSANISSSE